MSAALPTWPMWCNWFESPRAPGQEIEIVEVYRDPLDGRRLVLQFNGSVSDKEVGDVRRHLLNRRAGV